MRSPRFAPAGLLIERHRHRVALDGGPGAAPNGRVNAWLVTDERAELIRDIRELARRSGVVPKVTSYVLGDDALRLRPLPVLHTSHPTYGYRIDVENVRIAWLPEFLELPAWADRFDLVFADGAGWARPIRFAHRTGGHACVLDVARQARARGIRRLVFAHLGRPTLRALDAGECPPFGEMGHDKQVFTVRGSDIAAATEGHKRSRAALTR
jgi:hypothetical protein